MLNIGAGEIALIAVVALLLLGPTQLPELARGLGRMMRELRSRTDEVRHVVEREFYKMDDEVQALPPRAVAPPPSESPSVLSGELPGAPPPAGAPTPEVSFVPDTVPLDPSFARTEQHAIVPPASDGSGKSKDGA